MVMPAAFRFVKDGASESVFLTPSEGEPAVVGDQKHPQPPAKRPLIEMLLTLLHPLPALARLVDQHRVSFISESSWLTPSPWEAGVSVRLRIPRRFLSGKSTTGSGETQLRLPSVIR